VLVLNCGSSTVRFQLIETGLAAIAGDADRPLLMITVGATVLGLVPLPALLQRRWRVEASGRAGWCRAASWSQRLGAVPIGPDSQGSLALGPVILISGVGIAFLICGLFVGALLGIAALVVCLFV
jgi:hypothetical protein